MSFSKYNSIHFITILFFLFLPSFGLAADKKNPIKEKITAILKSNCVEPRKVGIKIVNLTSKETIYERNSHKQFLPASNLKLITSAAALKKLNPDYQFRTVLSTDGVLENGILTGNLYIKGYGDPKLVSEEMWIIVKDLAQRGIKTIKGNIIGDSTFFDNEKIGNGWGKRLSSYAYHAKMGALSLNFNSIAIHVEPSGLNEKPVVVADPPTAYVKLKNKAVTIKKSRRNGLIIDRIPLKEKDQIIVTGKISQGKKRKTYYRNISYPRQYLLTVFREMLEQYGIKVEGTTLSGKQPDDARILLTHKSRPLGYIIRDLNKMSNNFVAEQILKTMAAEIKGEPGTTEKGILLLKEFLKEAGITGENYVLADGSGLSKLNRLTPDILIKVLSYMAQDFISGPEFTASLGVMGIDGSIEDRLKKSIAQRMVRAKTGTLNGVICLSGYARTTSGNLLAFSILTNDLKCNPNKIMSLQDKIILAMIQ